jgi:hypothetical protein
MHSNEVNKTAKIAWQRINNFKMPKIMTIKPRLHFIFQNDSNFAVRNLFAGIVLLGLSGTSNFCQF